MARTSIQKLKDYEGKNPQFVEIKNNLRKMVSFHAKQNIADKIINEKDTKVSAWYLSKCEDSFNPARKVENSHKVDIASLLNSRLGQITPIAQEIKEINPPLDEE